MIKKYVYNICIILFWLYVLFVELFKTAKISWHTFGLLFPLAIYLIFVLLRIVDDKKRDFTNTFLIDLFFLIFYLIYAFAYNSYKLQGFG